MNNTLLQELYVSPKSLTCFFSVMTVQGVSCFLMIHDAATGVPFLYADNILPLFGFDNKGFIISFNYKVKVQLFDSAGNNNYYVEVLNNPMYGITFPMFTIFNKSNEAIYASGILDFAFEGRLSGTYLAQTTPNSSYPLYTVTNITKMIFSGDIPVVEGFNIPVSIPSGGNTQVPVTEPSTYYLRQAASNKLLQYKLT